MKTKLVPAVVLIELINAACFAASAGVYDIRSLGATPDGQALCTEVIQNAVDQCTKDGGGIVYFPPGWWLTGTVYLADNVTVELANGCTVLGTTDKSQYGPPRQLKGAEGEQYSTWAIFAGKGLRSIAIRGRGTIDGQGSNFKYKQGARPKNLYFEDCQDVLIEGVRLRSAGSWMQHYRNCERLTIRDVAVFNHVSYNNDGLNIDSCRDVVVSGSVVDSDDDAIVLKSLSRKPCENIAISDCVVSSHCNSIKMGTESGGGFQDITITNCTICSPRYSQVIYGRQRGLAGLALEIVDGGTLDRVAVSNITIKGVTTPVFMRLGDRARTYEKDQPRPPVGTFRNVIVSNIIATDCSSVGCAIAGLPDHPIEDVTLSNIRLGFEGGGTTEDASRPIPEKPDSYPESTMFGTLPSYGLFCRHVKGLRLQNIRLQTSTPDCRHALVLDDAEDAVIDSLDAPFTEGAAAMVRLHNVRDVFIRNCHPPEATRVFLSLAGPQSKAVSVHGNDFADVKTVSDCASDTSQSVLALWSNHMPERR